MRRVVYRAAAQRQRQAVAEWSGRREAAASPDPAIRQWTPVCRGRQAARRSSRRLGPAALGRHAPPGDN
ncbi:hypothetical protein MTO96_041121 [Rhipicephalus appendiculatus]